MLEGNSSIEIYVIKFKHWFCQIKFKFIKVSKLKLNFPIIYELNWLCCISLNIKLKVSESFPANLIQDFVSIHLNYNVKCCHTCFMCGWKVKNANCMKETLFKFCNGKNLMKENKVSIKMFNSKIHNYK